MNLQPINEIRTTNNNHLPRILNFQEHYKAKHKTEPGSQITTEEEKDTNEVYKFSTSKKILIPFLGSILLTVGAYTTSFLDKFKDSIKQFIRSTLMVISLSLGSITLISFLREPNNNKESDLTYFDEEHF